MNKLPLIPHRRWLAGNALALAAVILGPGIAPTAQAQSADALIDKLVEKGILSVDEANTLREESDKGFNAAHSVKTGLPDWVTSMRFNGDFRGRYEGFYADNPAFTERQRFRYRARFGWTAVIQDNFEIGLRLGSGDLDRANSIVSGVDPISNNQSFQNNASKKGVFLDLAYAKWTPLNLSWLTGGLTLGKMENPFVFSDMVFDGDYTPEGAAQQFVFTVNERHALKLNVGEFVLDEISGSSHDPWMAGAQLRWDGAWSTRFSSSMGVSLLSIQNDEQLASSAVPDLNTGNSRPTSVGSDGRTITLGAPLYGFNPVVLDASLTYFLESAPLYTGAFPIKLFGEYIYNGAASDRNTGYAMGVTFGKAGKRKTWEITYRYKHLEGDAWFEEVVDSDSGAFYQDGLKVPPPLVVRAPGTGYGAGTNIRGHIVKAGYSPFDSLQLNLSWFGLDLIDEYQPGTDSFMNRVQVDAVWKF